MLQSVKHSIKAVRFICVTLIKQSNVGVYSSNMASYATVHDTVLLLL